MRISERATGGESDIYMCIPHAGPVDTASRGRHARVFDRNRVEGVSDARRYKWGCAMKITHSALAARAEAAKALLSLILAVSVGFWAQEFMNFLRHPGVVSVESVFIGASGAIYLLDILCIAWWYANYIYRIQPISTFGNYFLDFVICSMFVLGAHSWTQPATFLFATAVGSALLVVRFFTLYNSVNATQKDRGVLRYALLLLMAAVVLAAVLYLLLKLAPPERIPDTVSVAPGAFAAIGVGLTLMMRRRIDVAADISEAARQDYRPTPLHWPGGERVSAAERMLIRERAQEGLDEFARLFDRTREHMVMPSRVHSRTDLHVQAYVLGISSVVRNDVDASENLHDEIRNKALVAAAAHWLDDLVDGREEHALLKRLPVATPDPSLHAMEALFHNIYRRLVVKHTDSRFYDELVRELFCGCCSSPANTRYLHLGFVRVAWGAALFSPKINPDRREAMVRTHNEFLINWHVEGSAFTNEVEDLLREMARSGVGANLLALTTKTVQEMAMASERIPLNISVSVLMSIMFAPLLYYHDIEEELATGEMVSLEAFDSDYDLWSRWLERARSLLDRVADATSRAQQSQPHGGRYNPEIDPRIEHRLLQLEMAYRCFEGRLPEHLRRALRPVYVAS